MMNVKMSWNGDMTMVASNDRSHEVTMDTYEKSGGKDAAQTPKEIVLSGLAGCTAMDVIGILRKMRIEPKGFRIEVESDQTDEHPKIFKNIKMKYYFKKSDDADENAKFERAVKLSQDQYCGVSAMLKKAVDVSYEIHYE